MKVHAIPGVQKDEVQHHGTQSLSLDPKKECRHSCAWRGFTGNPLGTSSVGSRGFRQAVHLALCPQVGHPLGSEDMFLQDRAVLCCELAMGKLEVILV